MKRIYLSPPHMGGEELQFLNDAFASNWIAPLGPHVDAFEKELGALVGCSHACALSSGTAALHLALRLLGVGRGDRVLCPTLTFAASANVIAYEGAGPVFLDVDPATWNLDPALLEQELHDASRAGQLPKAVIVVDLYGQCADYARIGEICAQYGIPIIEDAAEALGATYRGRQAGTLGKLGVFSFNGNKIITTSGGGMLVGEDRELIERARFLATQARDPALHYQHSAIGFNYRLSNLLAAVGRGQLRVLRDRVAMRRRIRDRYLAALGDLPGVTFMPYADYGEPNGWLTCLCMDANQFGATREQVRLALEAANIEARPVWKPLHMQPVFSDCRVRGGAVAEKLFADGLCLPSGSSLTADEQEQIITLIRQQHAAR